MHAAPATDEQQRLLEVIRAAKELNTYHDVSWESWRWEVLQYDRNKRAHHGNSYALLFTRRRENRTDPAICFAPPYSDFAKAIIRIRASLRGVGASAQQGMILALRFLYEALHRSRLCDPTCLTRRHFHIALEDAHRECSEATTYSIGHSLSEIGEFLNRHQLTRIRIHFESAMRRPFHGDGTDAASQAAGLKKMPSQDALGVLAAMSSNPTDDNECVLLRIVDLLVVGGFRAGEALTLPRDCWVEETALDAQGRPKTTPGTGEPTKRCGLRYWPEKGGDPIVKWLPDCSVPLARRAVDDLNRLCQKAREAAAMLERNPDRVPIPGGFAANRLLSMKELAEILCLPRKTSLWRFLTQDLHVLPAKRIKLGRVGYVLYCIRDIERALLKRRGPLEVVHTPGGRAQMLSESLCVVFHGQFDPGKPTFPFLPELVTIDRVSRALGKRREGPSLFSRHRFVASDGTRFKITTHAFRHWINTLADQGGLSDVELARWMGRKDIRQNEAYKHGTVEQRVAWAQEMLKAGKLHGPTASTYQAIQETVSKEEFLRTFVSVAHFTPYGVCTHDFALTPCQYHLNCLAGCAEYLRTQGDREERQNLIQLRAFTVLELKKAESALSEQSQGASSWVDFNRRMVVGIDAALAVDEGDTPPQARAVTAVFPDGKNLGRAIPDEI